MAGPQKPGGTTDLEIGSDTVARVLRGTLGARQACAEAGFAPDRTREWARAFRRSALRAFDAGLRRALESRGEDSATLGAAEFGGALRDLCVSDLLEALALSRRDAVLAIAHDGVESRLWCSGGEIVDAESGSLRGEAAVYRALALEDGHLMLELYPVERARTVHARTARLLLEAARRKDEHAAWRAPRCDAIGARASVAGTAAGSRFGAGRDGEPGELARATAEPSRDTRRQPGDAPSPPSGVEGPLSRAAAPALSLRPPLGAGKALPAPLPRWVYAAGALAFAAGLELAPRVRAPGATPRPELRAERTTASLPAPPAALRTRPSPAAPGAAASLGTSQADPSEAARPLPAPARVGLDASLALAASDVGQLQPGASPLGRGPAAALPEPAVIARRTSRPSPGEPSARRLASPEPEASPLPRPPGTLVPRMQIIEENVPRMQIVE